ncbi:hypothetical protein PG999_006163 [Apiospora kogelbergensis]|uniref:Calcineurin-like phosphoesterase domain-containing protein n=1 Tax=Apiospora kogelbergensis TaxID=1337665 RepID=A0AAW0QRZ6_9PEZI
MAVPTSYLNPRYRRRRLFVFVAGLLILTTVYMSSRFDSGMPTPDAAALVQKLHLSTTPGAEQNREPSPKDENGSTDTTDEVTEPLQFSDAQLGTVTNHDVRKQIPLDPVPPKTYGTSARAPFKSTIPIATLPPNHVPRAAAGSPRLIIIGDVHGQLKELKTLLQKTEYNAERGDHVIFTGDMINKGPDSSGVVALAMEMGASGVRGNHEDKVLRAHQEAAAAESSSENQKRQEAATSSKGESAALATSRELSPEQREWLAKLPLALRLGQIPDQDSGEWVVVHAGLVPEIPLEDQDAAAVMNMRTLMFPGREQARQEVRQDLVDAAAAKQKKIDVSDVAVEAAYEREEKILAKNGVARNDIDAAVPTETRDGLPWSDAWNKAQKARKRKQDRVSVVYGHDAKTGLNIQPYSFGLDSSCVRGGKLSALVFEPGRSLVGRRVVKHKIVSIECEKSA